MSFWFCSFSLWLFHFHVWQFPCYSFIDHYLIICWSLVDHLSIICQFHVLGYTFQSLTITYYGTFLDQWILITMFCLIYLRIPKLWMPSISQSIQMIFRPYQTIPRFSSVHAFENRWRKMFFKLVLYINSFPTRSVITMIWIMPNKFVYGFIACK